MGNQLINIEEKDGNQIVSARELYENLGFDKTNWKRWYLKNIVNNGFAIVNEDWEKLVFKTRKVDFALTLDFAKRLSMLARTEQGEKIRGYFVACEKKLKEGANLLSSDVMAMQHAKIKELETKVKAIENKTETSINAFTVMGYGSLVGQFVDVRTASIVGKKAAAICKKEGFIVATTPDPRFGKVNIYPVQVLKRVFKNISIF